jgi:GTP pyrophosphokinase
MASRNETRPGRQFTDKAENFELPSEFLVQAAEFAREKHRGQHRRDGSEYFSHCIATASILRSWGLVDEQILASALLHDVVEDCGVSLEEIKAKFGTQISSWVDGVSKLKNDEGASELETQRKIVERGYFEPQVILIKLADRLHNMKTLSALPGKKQIHKAVETLDIYAPLAESLGVWQVKTELEDLSLPFVEPDRFAEIKAAIDKDPRLAEEVVANLESRLAGMLAETGLDGKVELRLKGYYESDKKRERLSKGGRGDGSLSTISDIISFRVVLSESQPRFGDLDPVLACYTFMGMVHQSFGPSVEIERFDDFLAAPAINGYRALQTTVHLPQGPVEIAVTTSDREDFNNWGIISKIRSGVTDLRDYVRKVVFTPTLKIKFMEKNATGWDFAYRISPLLGAQATQIEINGEIKPLSTVLPNASTVKVILGGKLAPSRSDLEYVSGSTRQIMEEQLGLLAASEAIASGRELLAPDLASLGLLELEDLDWVNQESGQMMSLPLATLLVHFGCTSTEGLYLQLGHGRVRPDEVVNTLVSLGVSKESLGWSTIAVTGRDQPGILGDFSALMAEMNKNIIGVYTGKKHSGFELRLVVDSLNMDEQTAVARRFESDSRFDQIVIV